MKLVIRTISFVAALLLGNPIFSQTANYCPANPHSFIIRQPDNSTLEVRNIGDEKYSSMVTVDGYRIIKNEKGIYEYAILSNDKRLICSGVKAKSTLERTSEENILLKIINTNIHEYSQLSALSDNFVASVQQTYSIAQSFPKTGTRRLLVILIDFNNLPFTINNQIFDNLMNQQNYNQTGSFRDYWINNSFNSLTINSTVVGWYHASGNAANYGAPTIVNGIETNHDNNPKLLVQQAIDAAESAGINFSQFDNDGDHKVDGVVIIHSGQGQEDFGSFPNATLEQANTIWSHRGTLGTLARNYDGVTIDDYDIVPELDFFMNVTTIGVICHEFGHILGLPDLYDTKAIPTSEGIGNWDLMASGSWNNWGATPSNLSAWCKSFLGWQTPTIIQSVGGYSILNASQNNVSYRINTPHSNEYFLIENRQPIGFDAALPGTGLAIWHINTDKTSTSHISANDVNNIVDLKGVDLEEADGLNQLDAQINRGNMGDLYPGLSCNHTFNENSTPNSSTYSPVVNTNKPITNIIESNNRAYFNFIGYNSISGPSVVCSSDATFTFNNMPSGCSINWTFSSNLIYVSGQGTNQLIVKAGGGGGPSLLSLTTNDNYGSSGLIRATITGSCDDVIIEKTPWVGLPAYTPIVTGSSTVFCSQSLYVEKYNRNATWSVYGPLQVIGANYGYKGTVKGTESGVGWVYATNSNVCGSFRGELLVQVTCSSYSVFPNPTNSEVTISLLADNSIDGSFQKNKSIKSIRVVDKSGITLSTQKYGSETFETKIDLSKFTTGVYIIKINEGPDEESYTIVKQ